MIILRSANPNRHGPCKLIQCDNNYLVIEPDDCNDEGHSFDTLAEATKYYEFIVAHYSSLPNWDAQAEYDEQWGEPLYQYPY